MRKPVLYWWSVRRYDQWTSVKNRLSVFDRNLGLVGINQLLDGGHSFLAVIS